MSLPILIRYDRGHRGQAPAPKTLREHRVQLPVRLSIHSRRGYDDPTVISPVVIIGKENTVAGRHRAKGTISSLRTSRQRQAGFRARRALRKHNRKADRKYRYGSAMSESGSKTGSRKPQSQRLGLLVTGIIFHELRALVKFRIGNVTGGSSVRRSRARQERHDAPSMTRRTGSFRRSRRDPARTRRWLSRRRKLRPAWPSRRPRPDERRSKRPHRFRAPIR